MSKNLIAYSTGFLWKLRWEGGGELPKDLTGAWTKKELAVEAANNYLVSKKPSQEKVNAKGKSGA